MHLEFFYREYLINNNDDDDDHDDDRTFNRLMLINLIMIEWLKR